MSFRPTARGDTLVAARPRRDSPGQAEQRLGTALHDPADMLIVASAQHHGARLVTSDARIHDTERVPVVT